MRACVRACVRAWIVPVAADDGGVHGAETLGCAEGTGSVSADRRRASSPEVSRASNLGSRGGGAYPEEAETQGTGEGARPSEAVPWTHGPRASHASRPRTRNGAKAS